MAFITVVYVGLDAKRNERPHATDTKDQFLLQPVLRVTAVEVVCYGPVFRNVFLDVGIKKEQIDLPYRDKPYAGLDCSSGPGQKYSKRIAFGILNRCNRYLGEILRLINCLLFALGAELLPEIAVPDTGAFTLTIGGL
jgi:hypothetical protein